MTIFQKVLFQGRSSFNGDIRVVEGFGERRLIASNYTQSKALNRDGRTGSYWDGFVQNLPALKKDSRVLILGLAAGTIAKLFTNKFGPLAIDGVEIDPLMVELGQKYFDFHEKNVKVIIADALKFVKEARFKYDVVAVDLFAQGGTAVGAESKDFFKDVLALLNPEGVVVINKLYTSKEDLNNYLDFLEKVFDKTSVLTVQEGASIGNVIVYASK